MALISKGQIMLREWGIGEKSQKRIGKALYHTISITRWDRNGKTLRMNPTHIDIDKLFATFRKNLNKRQSKEFIKKIGSVYYPEASRSHDCYFPLPMRGDHVAYTFSLSDIVYAKNVMKRHKAMFESFIDWNDLPLLVKMLRSKKARKPKLTAQIIFAAWTFQNDWTP